MGLAAVTGKSNFDTKLFSLKEEWKGYVQEFMTDLRKRNDDFAASVIQSVREGTVVKGTLKTT